MRAISAPRSQRTVKIRSPLPRGPSIAKRPKRPQPRDERAAVADVFARRRRPARGTRRQSRSHTARFTS